MLLEDLGWNGYFMASWNDLDKEEFWVPARVVSQQRGLWRIVGACGEAWASPSGKLRERAGLNGDWPAVGDWVAVQVVDASDRANLHAVLPRRSEFGRKAAGKRIEQQVIAANVDTAFLVAALDGDLNLRRLERYLAQTWESRARPVILLNKADTCSEVGSRISLVERVASGVEIFPVSGLTGDGLGALDPFLAKGQTVVLLGSSGVGKSTIVNRLLGQQVQMTQPVRESDSRGRHTTTTREMLRLVNGAMVIDTPGLRELQLWDAADGVSETFGDIERLGEKCKFRDCKHTGEPGCAVLAAVAEGMLDEGRLENRRKLEREQEFLRQKMDPEARSEANRRVKVLMRGVKRMYEQRERDRSKT